MGNETHQSISFSNEIQLRFPQIDRAVVQDIEHRIILRRGERQFEDVSDKKWHHGTTATALWLKVSNVGYGHVVGKLVCIVPIEVAVHDSCTEAMCMEFFDVLINFFGAL